MSGYRCQSPVTDSPVGPAGDGLHHAVCLQALHEVGGHGYVDAKTVPQKGRPHPRQPLEGAQAATIEAGGLENTRAAAAAQGQGSRGGTAQAAHVRVPFSVAGDRLTFMRPAAMGSLVPRRCPKRDGRTHPAPEGTAGPTRAVHAHRGHLVGLGGDVMLIFPKLPFYSVPYLKIRPSEARPASMSPAARSPAAHLFYA